MLKLTLVFALCVVPFVVSFHLNSIEDATWDEEPLQLDERLSKNITVSLDQFEVYNELGNGAFGSVFVAKKLGGSDHGTVYALKAIELRDHTLNFIANLNSELEIMIATRDLPHSIKLHYAFRHGKWLFLVMEFLTGGDLVNKIKKNGTPDASTAKIILAEVVAAVEALHKANVSHEDLGSKNTMIDNDGHLRLIDYGISCRLSEYIEQTQPDWGSISRDFEEVFPEPIKDKELIDVMKLLADMNLSQVPELKSLPYFRGIDWKQVAERKSVPPFNPSKTELEFKLQNKTELFNDNEMDANTAALIAEKFHNYTFVAWEHQY